MEQAGWKGECFVACSIIRIFDGFFKQKVLGAISLADTILTAMPAPEFSFRLSRSGRFRDFRADSASNLATWLKHLNEEIAARSGGGSGAGGIGGGDKNASAPVPAAKLTMSRRDGMEMSGQMTAGGDISKQSDDRAKQLEEKNKQLEAEILILKQRVKELEAKNAGLEAASGGGGGGGRTAVEEPEDAKAAELLKVQINRKDFCFVSQDAVSQAMNMGGDANMRDQVEDLTFQLKAAQKRLKQAAQTIKTQAQRIQLLEGNDKT